MEGHQTPFNACDLPFLAAVPVPVPGGDVPNKTRKKKRPEFEGCYVQLSGTKKGCVFCDKIITGSSISRIKRHWAGAKRADVSPCLCVPDDVRRAALEDIETWEARKREKKTPGSVVHPSPGGPANAPHLPNRPGSENTSRHSPSDLAPEGLSLPAYTNAIGPIKQTTDDMLASTMWAIQKWLLFTGLPYHNLSASDFQQLRDDIASVNRLPSSYINPPMPLIDANDIFTKLRGEVDDYVKTIRSSWGSTGGCTICLGDIRMGEANISVAVARCPQGAIFLKYVERDHPAHADFLNSIIEEVGLDNITQILVLDYNYLWDGGFSFDEDVIQNLWCEEAALYLAFTYKHLFILRDPRDLIFRKYASFVANICSYFDDGLASTINFDYDDSADIMPALSAMMTKKQEISAILNKMERSVVVDLPFWNNEEDYDLVHRIINDMLVLAKKDHLTLPTYTDVLKQGNKKQQLCELIVNVISSDEIIPNSKFWKSLEAYIRLYKHIYKLSRHLGNGNFTYADCIVAYAKAKSTIREEDFCKEDYEEIMDGMVYFLRGWDGITCASYLSPQVHDDVGDVFATKYVESDLLRMMRTNEDKETLRADLLGYREKDGKCFKEDAWSPTEIMIHPKAWWGKWGNEVPLLQKLAIKILSRLCSNDHVWRVIEDMHAHMSSKHQGQILHDLFYLRLNNHFKYTTTKDEDNDLASTRMEWVNELQDFSQDHFLGHFSEAVEGYYYSFG